MSTIHKIEYIGAEPRVKEERNDIGTDNIVWLKIQGQHLGGRTGKTREIVYLCLSEENIRGLLHAMLEAAAGGISKLSTEDSYVVRGKDQAGNAAYEMIAFGGEDI